MLKEFLLALFRNAAAELYKRLFWAGYRGSFEVVDWEGDEGIHDWDLFDPNVNHAFQTAPSMLGFLRDYVPSTWNTTPSNINIMAHSLGNLVVFDALRLHHTSVPGGPISKLVNNVISVEAAVWEETFWDEQDVVYVDDPITYTIDDLKHHSWCSWFNQANHPVANTVDNIFLSRIDEDSALIDMQRNDWFFRKVLITGSGAYDRLGRFRPHDYRVAGTDSSLLEANGTPNLGREIPAMLNDTNNRKKYFLPMDLTKPLGITLAPAAFMIDIDADAYYGWPEDEHSGFKVTPYHQIVEWYDHLMELPQSALDWERE